MITTTALSCMQEAINTALNLDADLALKLAPLQQKLIQLIIRPFGLPVWIEFTASGIQLHAEAPRPADTIIQSSPLSLLRMSLLPSAKVRALFNEEVNIEGDLELGLQVKHLFNSLELDWEGLLARYIGDVAAHQVGRVVRGGAHRVQEIGASLTAQCNEYLHEEVRLVPSSEEVEDFFADIDELSLHVERLEAQLNYYRAHYATD